MKGNLFLGYGRGSVGDVVFSRTGGQQVGRARNRKPNNPKTKAQVAHRALFADAVKFYTHGSQSFFKFAFEDKQAQESDYNAFMRINAKRGFMLSPEALGDANYPAIGNWIMSKGSLTPISGAWNVMGEAKQLQFNLGISASVSESSLTVAKMTELLVETGNYEVGDILTFVYIDGAGIHEPAELEPVSPEDRPPLWHIIQFILDPSDTRYVGAIWDGSGFELIKVANSFYIRYDDELSGDVIAGGCAVHSRKTDAGLKVSTSEMINSDGVLSALAYANSTPYRSYIYSAWSAASDAVLEGALAESKV